MPKWGLTAAMRSMEPWALKEEWLRPGKVITDPVHGDIYLTKLERSLVDSPAFQRLRKVRQLGTTHLVYPGATHTRFSHALGALRVTQDLMDTLIDQRSGRDPKPDLFLQWETELKNRTSDGRSTWTPEGLAEFDRRVAEAIILARLGGLLHDLCHVPYGHSIEDEAGILDAHDKNSARFDRLWQTIPRPVRAALSAGDLTANLRRLILSKEKPDNSALKYPFVADVVGNTICADLLDYLRRDHLFTGLPLALGRRFESGFYVAPRGHPEYGEHVILGVSRGNDERRDVITEVLKHLRYRYELSERALVHHAKIAADAMIGKALEMWHDALWVEGASGLLAGHAADAPSWPAGRNVDELRKVLIDTKPRQLDRLDLKIKHAVDTEMTRRGDDSLLEYLQELGAPGWEGERRDEGRRHAVAALAQDIERRVLYKRVARQNRLSVDREEFYEQHAGPENRRRKEQRAARFAGIEKAWWIVLWIPPWQMRLKVADVLVHDGEGIRKFADREEVGKQRDHDIYAAHEDLWAVSVYMHPNVPATKRRLALASLSADLNIDLVEDAAERSWALGTDPYEWRDRIAVSVLRRKRPTLPSFEELWTKHRQVAARGAPSPDNLEASPSLAELVAVYDAVADGY